MHHILKQTRTDSGVSRKDPTTDTFGTERFVDTSRQLPSDTGIGGFTLTAAGCISPRVKPSLASKDGALSYAVRLAGIQYR